MGTNILKGCEGVTRIVIVVFLFISTGFTSYLIKVQVDLEPEYYYDFGFIVGAIHLALCGLCVVLLCVWYLLLLRDVIKKPEHDGCFCLVCGIVFVIVAAVGIICWILASMFSEPWSNDGSEQEKAARREKGTERRANVKWGVFGSLLFLLASVLLMFLGCKLRCSCCGAGKAGEPKPEQIQVNYQASAPEPTNEATPAEPTLVQ